MRLKEAPQPRHQPFRDQARRCRNDQHIALTRALELANGVAHGFQTGLQAGIDQASGLRQLDRARAPGEQRQAKLLLQPSDLVAERGQRETLRLLARVDAATLRDLGITDIESAVYGDPRDRMRGYDADWWRNKRPAD